MTSSLDVHDRNSSFHNSKCEPTKRLHCGKNVIVLGEKEYNSASVALLDYIELYDGTRKDKLYNREISDLLAPKPPLLLTAERSLETGIRATPEELRLYEIKKAIEESYNKMKAQEKSLNSKMKAQEKAVDMRQQMDQSAIVMSRVESDDLSTLTCDASDIGSMTTDMMISVSPQFSLSISKPETERRTTNHVYSYKTPTTQKNTSTKASQKTNNPGTSHKLPTFKDNALKQITSSTPKLKVIKGRVDRHQNNSSGIKYMPPSSRREESPMSRKHRSFISPVERSPISQLLRSESSPRSQLESELRIGHPLPSWVEGLDFSAYLGPSGRAPPSWIKDLEGSDVTSVISGWQPMQRDAFLRLLEQEGVAISPSRDQQQTGSKYKEHDVSDGASLGASGVPASPGLTYKDLLSDSPLPPRNLSKPVYYVNSNSEKSPYSAKMLSNSQREVIREDMKTLSSQSNVSRSKFRHSNDSNRLWSSVDESKVSLEKASPQLKINFKQKLLSGADVRDFQATDSPPVTLQTSVDQYLTHVKNNSATSSQSLWDISDRHQVGISKNFSDTCEAFSISSIPKASDQEVLNQFSDLIDDISTNSELKSSPIGGNGSVCTMDTDAILEGDRPWETTAFNHKPALFANDANEESPKSGLVDDFLADCLRPSKIKHLPTLTGNRQPGSMEALKNMLFKLQKESAINSIDTDNSKSRESTDKMDLNQLGTPYSPPIADLKDCSFVGKAGGESLERALVHLNRLKNLVDNKSSTS